MLRQRTTSFKSNPPNATPKPNAKSATATSEQVRAFIAMVEGRDGSRVITDSPFMKEYRWKNHDIFPHSNYVERIRNLGYDESILGSQTCNQLVSLAERLYKDETTVMEKYKSNTANSNVFKTLYGCAGDYVDKSTFGNWTYNRVNSFVLLDIIISVTRATPPSPAVRGQETSASGYFASDARAIVDKAGALATVMEAIRDPVVFLSKALGNCWETAAVENEINVDLEGASTDEQKLYLVMVDCLYETPRDPLNKVGYQYRISENLHKAIFGIWWFLKRKTLDPDNMQAEIIGDAQRLNFETHFRMQLPTRLNSTLTPSEAMKPLQIACFITPLTLFCTKQMSRIPYKKQAIIAMSSSLSKSSPVAGTSEVDVKGIAEIEHELWKSLVKAAGGVERLDICMLNFKVKLYNEFSRRMSLPQHPSSLSISQAAKQRDPSHLRLKKIRIPPTANCPATSHANKTPEGRLPSPSLSTTSSSSRLGSITSFYLNPSVYDQGTMASNSPPTSQPMQVDPPATAGPSGLSRSYSDSASTLKQETKHDPSISSFSQPPHTATGTYHPHNTTNFTVDTIQSEIKAEHLPPRPGLASSSSSASTPGPSSPALPSERASSSQETEMIILKSQVHQLQSVIVTKESQLSQMMAYNAKHSQDLEELRSAERKHERKLRELQGERDQIFADKQSAHAELQQHRSSTDSQVQVLNDMLNALNRENEELKGRHQSSIQTLEAELQNKTRLVESQNETLLLAQQQYEEKVRTLESERESDRQATRTEFDQLRHALEGEKESYQDELAAIRRLSEENRRKSDAKLESTRKKMIELEGQHEASVTKLRTELTERLKKAKSESEELRQGQDALRAENQRLLEESQDKERVLLELQSSYQELEDKMGSLSLTAENRQKSIASLIVQNAELEHGKDQLKQERDGLKRTNESLAEDKKSLLATRQQLMEERAVTDEQTRSLQQQLEESKASEAAMQVRMGKQLQALSLELREYNESQGRERVAKEQENVYLLEQLRSTQSRLDTAEQERTRFSTELEKMSSEKQALEVQKQDLDQQKAKLVEQNSVLKRSSDQLEEQVNSLKQERAENLEQNSLLRQEKDKLEEQVNSLKQERDDLAAARTNLNSTLAQMTTEKEELVLKASGLEKETTELKQTLQVERADSQAAQQQSSADKEELRSQIASIDKARGFAEERKRAEVERAETEKKELEERIWILQMAEKELRQQLGDQSDYEVLKDQLAKDKDKALEELKEKMDEERAQERQDDLDRYQQLSDARDEEMRRLRGRYERLKDELRDSEEEEERLSKTHAEDIERLTMRLDDETDELGRLRLELESVQTSLRTSEQQREAQKREFDETVSTVRVSLDRFREDITLLRAKGKQAEEEAMRKEKEGYVKMEKAERECEVMRRKVQALSKENSKLRLDGVRLGASAGGRSLEQIPLASSYTPPLEQISFSSPSLSLSTSAIRPSYPFYKSTSSTDVLHSSPEGPTSLSALPSRYGTKRRRTDSSASRADDDSDRLRLSALLPAKTTRGSVHE